METNKIEVYTYRELIYDAERINAVKTLCPEQYKHTYNEYKDIVNDIITTLNIENKVTVKNKTVHDVDRFTISVIPEFENEQYKLDDIVSSLLNSKTPICISSDFIDNIANKYSSEKDIKYSELNNIVEVLDKIAFKYYSKLIANDSYAIKYFDKNHTLFDFLGNEISIRDSKTRTVIHFIKELSNGLFGELIKIYVNKQNDREIFTISIEFNKDNWAYSYIKTHLLKKDIAKKLSEFFANEFTDDKDCIVEYNKVLLEYSESDDTDKISIDRFLNELFYNIMINNYAFK